MQTTCPDTADTVIFHAPDGWHPELGIREHPAIVLHADNPLTRHLALVVFTGIDAPYPVYWVPEGDQPGTWRSRA